MSYDANLKKKKIVKILKKKEKRKESSHISHKKNEMFHLHSNLFKKGITEETDTYDLFLTKI